LNQNGKTEYTNLRVSPDHAKYDYTILQNTSVSEVKDGENIEIPIFTDLNEIQIICVEIPNMEKIKHALKAEKITSAGIQNYYNKLM